MNEGGKDERDEQDVLQEPIKLDARDLRNRADAYAGLRGPRGDRYFFVQKGSPGHGDLERQHKPGEPPPEGTVFQLDTAAQRPDRPEVTNVIIESGGDTTELAHMYDAVFWSESAVEKFVFPYFASKWMWKAADYLTVLSDCWYGRGPCEHPTGEEDDSVPFAIAHVPDSDYRAIPDGSNLHLLVRTKEGKVQAHPLADLIAKREERIHGTADPAPQTPASLGGG